MQQKIFFLVLAISLITVASDAGKEMSLAERKKAASVGYGSVTAVEAMREAAHSVMDRVSELEYRVRLFPPEFHFRVKTRYNPLQECILFLAKKVSFGLL